MELLEICTKRRCAVREKLRRFMLGRYGGDQLGHFLAWAALVLFVLGMLSKRAFYWLGLAVLVYSYWRMFSRDIARRRAENSWYLQQRAVFLRKCGQLRNRFALRKTYRYFRCPQCRQQLRIPRGRGQVSIHCPKCGADFVRKS